ncbi:MAG: arsenite methyltransferase [Bacteriovoracaceae bacterium]|nr:arsenite methyltransferase [Bacteriovoracaceae bacterium]
MNEVKKDKIKNAVRGTYAKIAKNEQSQCCSNDSNPCCGPIATYSESELKSAPIGANMGLGCGNPTAIASLEKGQIVLDLGSGGGFDCFLASKIVGDDGKVIGVDMTPEMISKARKNAESEGYKNVEFRLGEIENIPAANESVDVVMSNCVINLSPDKKRVFQEIFRILKSGGKIAISDIVATKEIPEALKDDLGLYAGCMAGAETISEIKKLLLEVGLKNVNITPAKNANDAIRSWSSESCLENYVVSAMIEAQKE